MYSFYKSNVCHFFNEIKYSFIPGNRIKQVSMTIIYHLKIIFTQKLITPQFCTLFKTFCRFLKYLKKSKLIVI